MYLKSIMLNNRSQTPKITYHMILFEKIKPCWWRAGLWLTKGRVMKDVSVKGYQKGCFWVGEIVPYCDCGWWVLKSMYVLKVTKCTVHSKRLILLYGNPKVNLKLITHASSSWALRYGREVLKGWSSCLFCTQMEREGKSNEF